MTLTNAERQARHRASIAARLAGLAKPAPWPSAVPPKPRKQTRPARWSAAIATLYALLDEYETMAERRPEAQRDDATGELLAEVLELRDLVDQLAAVTLPKGFGRD